MDVINDSSLDTLELSCSLIFRAGWEARPWKGLNFNLYILFPRLGLALEPREDEFENEGRQSGSNSTPASPVEELVWRLHQDLSFFPWLTPLELENIAKMDRDEMRKVVPDDKFLEFLQDLCERYLQDKDKDQGGVTNILHDPIKLIRMYSKYNHFIGGSYDLNLRRTN